MQDFISLINNVGFPIACVAYLAWNQSTQMEKFTSTIERNTRVIERLSLKMDAEEVLEKE